MTVDGWVTDIEEGTVARALVVRRRITEISGFVVQILLIALALAFVFGEGDDDEEVLLLACWCALGTIYCLTMIATLSLSLRRPRPTRAEHLSSLQTSTAAHIVAMVAVFASSTVGISAAFYMLVLRDEPGWSGLIEIIGVWAMLLSWAMFHWGFAQIYLRAFYRASDPPLRFPGTVDPRITDFVYFAYTNATTFSVSDVHITDSPMRWRVMWHTTLGFFLNALLVVLAINTVLGK